MDIPTAILLGIVSGLFTTLIVVVIHFLWVKVIIPRYENTVYKDALIEGRWKGESTLYTIDEDHVEEWAGTYKISKSNKYNVDLIRVGHAVSGTMLITSGPDEGKSFRIEGSFRNLILAATYESMDRSAIDRGALSLMIEHNGEIFSGYVAQYVDPHHRVEPVKMQWRKES